MDYVAALRHINPYRQAAHQNQRVHNGREGIGPFSMSDFVICINNDSNPASLILGKAYRTLPDGAAESQDMLRVIDEDKSEPAGYLYPASMFAPVELPEAAERVLMRANN